jgi:hypothetical protein
MSLVRTILYNNVIGNKWNNAHFANQSITKTEEQTKQPSTEKTRFKT